MSRPWRDFDEHFTSPAWIEAAHWVCFTHNIQYSRLERAAGSDHIVFLIDSRLVLKIFRPSRNGFEREKTALKLVEGRLPFRAPEIVEIGRFEDLDYIITTQVPGRPISRHEFLDLPGSQQTSIIADLADGLRHIHGIDPKPFSDDWAAFVKDCADTFVARQAAHGVNADVLESLPGFLEKNLPLVPRTPTVFLHGDVHFGNLRFETIDGRLRISGLFDFADSRCGFHEYDLLAIGVLMLQGERRLQREFFLAYGYSEADLNDEMRDRLMMLTMLYETSDLRRYALRLAPEAVDLPLDGLTRAIWNFV